MIWTLHVAVMKFFLSTLYNCSKFIKYFQEKVVPPTLVLLCLVLKSEISPFPLVMRDLSLRLHVQLITVYVNICNLFLLQIMASVLERNQRLP